MLSLSPYRVTHASSLALEEELKLSNYPHISERCLSALRWYGRSRVPQPELQRYCTRPSILGELKKWVITTAGHFQIYAYGHGSVGTYFIVGFEENRTHLTWNVVSAVVVALQSDCPCGRCEASFAKSGTLAFQTVAGGHSMDCATRSTWLCRNHWVS